jgi:DtxR family Mn-dependent transcriptional regulator
MQHSPSKENYLKCIYKLLEKGRPNVSTNEIGKYMNMRPASVTAMLKKLFREGFIHYTPYYGVSLTSKGKILAESIVRKHRLWETFLVEIFQIPVEKVHDIAEQMEHVHSEELTEALNKFLNYPDTDPHGRKIPEKPEI